MNTLVPRLVSAALVVLSGLALWEMIQLKGAALFQQPSLASMAGVCCVIAGILGIAGCLVSDRFWNQMMRRGKILQSFFSQSANPGYHWSGSLVLSCSMIIYFVVMINLIPKQPSPQGNDQEAFLSQAQTVQEAGGPVTLVRLLWRGEYIQANQHPLYVAVLSYFPDYETGKRLSAMAGLLALLIFSLGITFQYGNLTGGLTGLLLSVNAAYCHLTGRAVCEGFLLVFVAVLWLTVLRLPDFRQSIKIPFRLLIGMGIVIGMAWLTKGTALLLLLGLIIWFCSYAISWNRLIPSSIRNATRTTTASEDAQTNPSTVSLKMIFGSLALLLASFTVVASPLLVRNARVYGSPTFNANSYLLFQDEFSDPHVLIKQGSLGATARTYFQTHSVPEIVKREVKGLVWQVFIFVRSLGPLPFEEGRLFFGLLAVPFLIIGLMSETHPVRRLYFIWVLLFWLAFAWYLPIAAGERFLMPLLLPTLAFISLGLVRTGQFLCQRRLA